MKPEHEQITPENVEEQIQHVVRTHGQQDPSMPGETHIIRELDRLYRSEEGIMARTWERLIEQHPEVGNLQSSATPPPPRIIHFQQRPTAINTKKGWKQRASMLLAVAISLVLIVSSFLLFHQNQGVSPVRKGVPVTGPLQLLDRHGKLFYQTDGRKTLTFGNDQHTSDFVQYTLQQLAQDLHVEPAKLSTMGLRVTTTLDLDLQNKAYANAQQQILKVKDTKNITDSAIVVFDYHDGSIRALIGSLNKQQNAAYNVATQNSRQLGSAYKPFVYATAFDQGISPGDVVNDTRTTFPGDYTPVNYDRQFHGLMSYRTALQNDYNIPAIQLLTRTKIAPTVAKVVALGLPSPPASQMGYSMALGVTEANVLNATVAYGTIANQGVHVAPDAIENITDTSGHLLFQARIQGTPVLSPASAFMITDVLSDNMARAATVGTCSPMMLYTTSQAQCVAGNPGTVRPAAAVLGSTETFIDSWTLGYTSDYAIGVWSGNDSYERMMNVTSLDGAAPIWHDTMLLAEGNAPIKQFPGPPSTVIKKTISDQGLTITDWHLK